MLTTEYPETFGWRAAIRGMRNPMNSWDFSDTVFHGSWLPEIGDRDLGLMKTLISAGTDHAKFMRMIHIQMDIVAPLYWWKEFDTYKVGTTANSCSTMHKITAKEFTMDDFSHDKLGVTSKDILKTVIHCLNHWRLTFNHHTDSDDEGLRKFAWYQLIQLLPSSYNQRRTVDMNYANAREMYHARRCHKQEEWRTFCHTLESLPYSDLITMEVTSK